LKIETQLFMARAVPSAARFARAFAREGARVFLSGRNAPPVEAVAKVIVASGGVAETATVHGNI